jgi:hypothetical protein
MIVKPPSEIMPTSRRASAPRSIFMGRTLEFLHPGKGGGWFRPSRAHATDCAGSPRGPTRARAATPRKDTTAQIRHTESARTIALQNPTQVRGQPDENRLNPTTFQPFSAVATARPVNLQQIESNGVRDQPRFRPEGPSVPASLRIQPPALR